MYVSSQNDSIATKLDAAKFQMTSTNTSAKVEVDLTSSGSFVLRYYTAYNSASDNYGRQIVFTGTALRYDSITNSTITTLWTK